MEKKIAICIGTDRQGGVRARLSLMIVEGEIVQSEHYHSITFMPGDDLPAGRAAVEAHIAKHAGGVPFAPWPAIPNEEWLKVEHVCELLHKAKR